MYVVQGTHDRRAAAALCQGPPGEGVGPYDIKGIGETPNTPTAAAIANAVADAVGARVRDLPVTSEKVYRLLQDGADRG